MSDLVERLRGEAARFDRMHERGEQPWVSDAGEAAISLEAAAVEIEWLRADEQRAWQASAYWRKEYDTAAAEEDRLSAERDALRAMLVWLARKGGLGLDVHERIRAALSAAPEPRPEPTGLEYRGG